MGTYPGGFLNCFTQIILNLISSTPYWLIDWDYWSLVKSTSWRKLIANPSITLMNFLTANKTKYQMCLPIKQRKNSANLINTTCEITKCPYTLNIPHTYVCIILFWLKVLSRYLRDWAARGTHFIPIMCTLILCIGGKLTCLYWPTHLILLPVI